MRKRGYYLWDWWGSKTIVFDPNIVFHEDDYAKLQGAYRRFDDCKAAGIRDIESQIDELQTALNELKLLKLKNVDHVDRAYNDTKRSQSDSGVAE